MGLRNGGLLSGSAIRAIFSRLLIKTSDLRFSLSLLHRGTTKIFQLDESEPQWGALIPTLKCGDFFSSLLGDGWQTHTSCQG